MTEKETNSRCHVTVWDRSNQLVKEFNDPDEAWKWVR